MPSARTIKARNGKYYKSNAEGIKSRKRDNYQNNPQNEKDASRASYKADANKAKETASKQNIIIIQSPKRQPLMINIELIQR